MIVLGRKFSLQDVTDTLEKTYLPKTIENMYKLWYNV